MKTFLKLGALLLPGKKLVKSGIRKLWSKFWHMPLGITAMPQTNWKVSSSIYVTLWHSFAATQKQQWTHLQRLLAMCFYCVFFAMFWYCILEMFLYQFAKKLLFLLRKGAGGTPLSCAFQLLQKVCYYYMRLKQGACWQDIIQSATSANNVVMMMSRWHYNRRFCWI